MSLIERAADILDSGPESKPTSAAATAAAGIPEADKIERSLRHEAIERAAALGPAAASLSSEALRAADTERTPVLKVDRDRLKQQNIITPEDARTVVSENFRRIKRHLLDNIANPNAGQKTNLVMITSALPGEGKTFCAVNLAISIAMEMDRTVLLVDADVARPSIASVLGIRDTMDKGLMDVLLGPGTDLASVLYRTDIEKLRLVPAGNWNARATEVLASEKMRQLLDDMAYRYHDRVIIFDSPPLLAASEAAALAARMGQILVVVEAGRTTEGTLKEALGRIGSENVLGVLLNKGRSSEAGYYGGYGYGYGYGDSPRA